MVEYVILLIILFYIFLYKKNILNKYYYTNHNNFLLNSFAQLNKEKYNKCSNFSLLKCVKFIKNNYIPNIFYYISDSINYTYEQSSLTLIKHDANGGVHLANKYKIMSKIFNLKVFGFKDVVLSKEGSIHSKCWNLTTSGGCICNNIPKISIIKSKYHQYDKAISITHHWGNAVFHSIGECLPKIGYYIPELLKNPEIKIHTYISANVKYLYFLGFNKSRIIYGNVYVKRLLILEKGGCGSPPPIIYTHALRNYIRNKVTSKPLYNIILIKRFGRRDIINFNEVYQSVANRFKNKKIVIFYPNTTFLNTLNYFKYAQLIVAPHGAGLTNMIISKDCTIIEFVSANLCYYGLARDLGLEYYGLYENITKGKFYVNISKFIRILEYIKI